jgi:16S rRNA (cytosine967-C5)-methyltransferase
VRPGGLIVYCTCSLENEEGAAIVDALLAGDSRLRRRPVTAAEVGGLGELLTAAGDLRTLPCHLPDSNPQLGGIDGFYAARLERI